MSRQEFNALARLIIHMAAVIVWALTRDKEAFAKVKEQGQLKWEEIREE
jgi:hypothetical protein